MAVAAGVVRNGGGHKISFAVAWLHQVQAFRVGLNRRLITDKGAGMHGGVWSFCENPFGGCVLNRQFYVWLRLRSGKAAGSAISQAGIVEAVLWRTVTPWGGKPTVLKP